VGVVLGEKAVIAANNSSLSKVVLGEINGARKYAEGRGIRLKVQSQEDLQSVELLAAIKMEN
jgi:carbohydrate-selective porin OprB